MTGASYEELFEIFIRYGDVEDVQLLPNRSYSFVHFAEVERSRLAYESIHGKLILPQQNNQPDQVRLNEGIQTVKYSNQLNTRLVWY